MVAKRAKSSSSSRASPPHDSFFKWDKSSPLAARMRPRTLEEFVGQEHILGAGKLLRRAIQADRLGSLIFAGPPGSGKTTLARVIANATRSEFETLNAVFAGVKDIRAVVDRARKRLEDDFLGQQQRTTLFVDEVHRFNKAQQDALLPHVENGTLTFIGATTENPYFEVIKALVSRSRVFELERLGEAHVLEVLRRALADSERGYGDWNVDVSTDALLHLAKMAQGDARNALNALELAVETTTPTGVEEQVYVDLAVAEESIQRRALLYDKDGDAHYDTISAFIKSLRGSDPDASLYWLAKMIAAGENSRFIARRLVIFASEDIGLADPTALLIANAAAQAVEYVGLPECQFNLAHACLHLALAPKSNSSFAYFEALRCVEAGASDEVPNHLKDASRDKKGSGHGVGYKYPHAFREHWVAQQYLPGALQGSTFYEPGNRGAEKEIGERFRVLRERQKAALGALQTLEEARQGIEPGKSHLRAEYGESALELASEVVGMARIDQVDQALVLGRPQLLAWAVLEQNPLVKIYAAHTEMGDAVKSRVQTAEAGVERLIRNAVAPSTVVPFRSGAVNVVIGWRLFGRSENPKKLAAELARVLMVGGELALAERADDEVEILKAVREVGFTELEWSARGGALLVYGTRPED